MQFLLKPLKFPGYKCIINSSILIAPSSVRRFPLTVLAATGNFPLSSHPTSSIITKVVISGGFIVAGGGKQEVFRCKNCGFEVGYWTGQCRECKEWASLESHIVTLPEKKGLVGSGGGAGMQAIDNYRNPTPQRGSWISSSQGAARSLREIAIERGGAFERIRMSGATGEEIGRVLGGGIVPGTFILVGGDPGIGKSTLMLQIAIFVSHPNFLINQKSEIQLEFPKPALYVTAEESAEQIYDRSLRLGFEDLENLNVLSETKLENIITEVYNSRPSIVILDSIQAVFLSEATGSAGSYSQVRECGTALGHLAKNTGIPIITIGHVTKTGDIAGPKVLEHIVDVVLYLEGEKSQFYRILRGLKNRYGATDEIGVFEMTASGLHAILNPSAMFLRDRNPLRPGVSSAIAVLIEGTRPLLLEIQALCTYKNSQRENPYHFHSGISFQRFMLVISVLAKYVKCQLFRMDIQLNVIGGMTIKEPAGDLAVALAIASAYFNIPIAGDVCVMGELGLGGELRPVVHLEKRLMEVSKMGFVKCVIPSIPSHRPQPPKIENLDIIQCNDISEVMEKLFATQQILNAITKDDTEF